MRPAYKFLVRDAIKEIHRIPVDIGAVMVIEGNLEWGQYEWRVEGGAFGGNHSDCGYGDPSIALRDGLIVFHGMPEQAPVPA